MTSPFAPASRGVRIALRVRPGAGRDRIGDIRLEADGRAVLRIAVNAAPEDGRANDAVVRLLAKEWGVARGALEVVTGAKSRRKTLHLAGEPAALVRQLEEWRNQRNDG